MYSQTSLAGFKTTIGGKFIFCLPRKDIYMDTSLGEIAKITLTTEILNMGLFAVFAVLEREQQTQTFQHSQPVKM